MKKIIDTNEYVTPMCATHQFFVEGTILTQSSDDNGSSLGALEDNVFGETF